MSKNCGKQGWQPITSYGHRPRVYGMSKGIGSKSTMEVLGESDLMFGAANQKLLCLASACAFVAASLYKVRMLRRGGTTVCQTNKQSLNTQKNPLYHGLAEAQDAQGYISHGSNKGKMLFVWPLWNCEELKTADLHADPAF